MIIYTESVNVFQHHDNDKKNLNDISKLFTSFMLNFHTLNITYSKYMTISIYMGLKHRYGGYVEPQSGCMEFANYFSSFYHSYNQKQSLNKNFCPTSKLKDWTPSFASILRFPKWTTCLNNIHGEHFSEPLAIFLLDCK
jgi:hypothetical protein